MATKAPLRPLANLLRSRPIYHNAAATPRRTFLNSLLPSSSPLTINVSRTLPYPRAALYDLIVDVDAYSSFLPFCQHSRVTVWSTTTASPTSSSTPNLDPAQSQSQEEEQKARRWPIEGQLTIGFGPITQSYTSRIVCIPGKSVEALSGQGEAITQEKDAGRNPFKRLVTKWSVADSNAPAGTVANMIAGRTREWTRVDLDLNMQLEDPLVQVMLAKVMDETATKMIDAFELRARQLFGGGSTMR